MRLKDIVAGEVYTYVQGRVDDYSTGEYVRVLSTVPHQYDHMAGRHVPVPDQKVGDRSPFGDGLVGILIAQSDHGADFDLSAPVWDGLTAEKARGKGIALTVVRQQELHPRTLKDELEVRRQAWWDRRERETEVRADRGRREAAAQLAISREVGQDVSQCFARPSSDSQVETLEAIATALENRNPAWVLAKAVERIQELHDRMCPDDYFRGLPAAIELIDPANGLDWLTANDEGR